MGSEDDVSGYELVVDGTWTFWGLNTGNAATAGFEFLYRDYSSDIPTVGLFTQVGALYPTTVAFSHVDTFVGGEMQNGKWMRQGTYKAVTVAPPYGDGQWRLFDVVKDPGETNDLAAKEPVLLTRLQQAWDDYAEEVGVILTE